MPHVLQTFAGTVRVIPTYEEPRVLHGGYFFGVLGKFLFFAYRLFCLPGKEYVRKGKCGDGSEENKNAAKKRYDKKILSGERESGKKNGAEKEEELFFGNNNSSG